MLNEKQLKLCEYISLGDNIAEAAEKAGCHRNSYYNWIEHPEFKAHLERLQEIAINESIASLKLATTRAVRKIIALMECKTNPMVSLQAAKDILARSGIVENIVIEAKRTEQITPDDIVAKISELKQRNQLKVAE